MNCLSDPSIAPGPQKCDPSATIPRADNYKQDSYVLYVMNAVFSIALGIEDAIRTLCVGQQPYGACNLYVTSGERRQKIKDGLLKVISQFSFVLKWLYYYSIYSRASRSVVLEVVNGVHNSSIQFKTHNRLDFFFPGRKCRTNQKVVVNYQI